MHKIRKAYNTEIDTLVSFQLAMAKETEELELDSIKLKNGMQAVFDDPTKGCYFVAEKDGEIAGSLLITYEWSDWRNAQVWWIQSVYVRKNFRKQGIYKSLYHHIVNIVNNDDSIAGIRLYVDTTNKTAQKTYEKLGMDGGHYQMFEKMD